MYRLLLVAAVFLFGTTEVSAAVSIHEVAWMGSTASANHEWIELHNSGSEAVSVDSWTLSDGMNLSITLAGSIGAGQYAVLERTSDASADGSAFLIYSGALVNTGATLVLRDAGNGIVDQIVGGSDWQNIGGDNATKETAQYTSSGWVTDSATPGAINRPGRVVPVDEENDDDDEVASTTANNTSGGSSSRNRSSGSNSTVRLTNVETTMTLKADVQSVVYVNQIVPFSVTARGNYKEPESMVRYSWNFGDRHAAEGKRVEHSYEYPGQYVVTVHAKNGHTEQTVRHDVTVLPVTFSLTKNTRGDIQVHNDAQYDVDVSGYVLRGTESFVFPPRTVMLARGTITVPQYEIGTSKHMVALYDAKEVLITSTLVSKPFVPAVTAEATVSRAETVVPAATVFGFGAAEALAAEPEVVSQTVVIGAEESDEPTTPLSARFWYLVFIGVFSTLFLVVFFVPRQRESA